MANVRELQIEGHKIVALANNEDKPGTPVVFIHGITESLNIWTVAQLPAVTAMPWYSLSLPGHYPGAFPSGFRAADLTAELIARVLLGAVRELCGPRQAILIGHSTGGFAARAMAAHSPQMVHAVCSIGGFAQGHWLGALGMMQDKAREGFAGRTFFRLTMKSLMGNRGLYKRGLAQDVVDQEALAHSPLLKTYLDTSIADASRLDVEAMLVWFSRMPDIDITEQLPCITAPTLVIAGENDPVVSPDQAQLIAAQVPNAERVLMPGGGHLPVLENTAEYQRTLGTWVKALA